MPSERYFDLNKRPVHPNYLLSVSCHNREQLISAANIGADLAVLCPVFATPSSPKGIPLGREKFSELAKFAKLPVYALGGLSAKDCQIAYDHGACGIAAIRALWG